MGTLKPHSNGPLGDGPLVLRSASAYTVLGLGLGIGLGLGTVGLADSRTPGQ